MSLLHPLAAGQSVADAAPGNQLIRAAAQALYEQPRLDAKIRQRATLLGQQLTGLGHYRQLRDRERLLLRYEFMLQLGEQTQSLLQVNDGTHLWIRRDKGPLQSQQCVKLRKLREAEVAAPAAAPLPPEQVPLDLALGGLSQSLHNLADHFDFAVPRESELKGVPTWEVDGRWKPDRWTGLAPGTRAAVPGSPPSDSEGLPEHLPDQVRVTLGRDQNFPLFPYRIEYGRSRRRSTVVGVASGQEHVVEPLVTMELFEVHRPPNMSPADFRFQPSNTEVEDLTDAYVRKLGLTLPRETEK